MGNLHLNFLPNIRSHCELNDLKLYFVRMPKSLRPKIVNLLMSNCHKFTSKSVNIAAKALQIVHSKILLNHSQDQTIFGLTVIVLLDKFDSFSNVLFVGKNSIKIQTYIFEQELLRMFYSALKITNFTNKPRNAPVMQEMPPLVGSKTQNITNCKKTFQRKLETTIKNFTVV